MFQTEFRLSNKDRPKVEAIRAKGLHHSREVNRAHILAALDRKVPQAQIMQVLGVSRSMVWHTRTAYSEGGLTRALFDTERPGRPREYQTDVEARITALAGSAPPEGCRRWTLLLLEQAARSEPGLHGISRETIRRLLKKRSQTLTPTDVVRRQAERGTPGADVQAW